MNYLRGALSAASQYYKDLPPINPSTLTGAIDVIVIERPTENGGTELVCSPFHVRFGKWQVLRPGEKKVKVVVNGHPIPFDMKIGDAGEAFFVFETQEDVPDDLITSPLLQPTVVGQPNGHDKVTPESLSANHVEPGAEEVTTQLEEPESDRDDDRQEPDFLDLNASQPEACSSAGRVQSPIESCPSSPEPPPTLSALRVPRATSEPPEYGVSPSPPPVYSWEWGGFPQRSPIRESYSSEQSEVPSSVKFPPLSETVHRGRAPSRPRSRSPIPEADGGRLEADEEDPYRVWLYFEGQRLGFELSLCGDDIHGEGLAVDAQRFDEQRVSYRQLMDDAGIVHNRQLVVRWDDEYISRKDDSPFMPALVGWRRRTLWPPASLLQNAEAGPRAPIAAPRPSTWSRWWSRNRVTSEVTESPLDKLVTPPETSQIQLRRPSLDPSDSTPVDTSSSSLQQMSSLQESLPLNSAPSDRANKKYAKTLRLTSDQLKALRLHKGANSITFSLSATGQVACTARIFLWDATDHIVVSDIDGTITKSDALGHVFTMIGRDWTHLGVAKLYTDICRNGYKILYLTSRAIGQADSTRDYLKGIKQNNYQLPEGPVIMSPDRLLTSLHREVIMRKPETFKMACLRDIQRLFGTLSHSPFHAGFGNRITDALSYRSVSIPSARIFTIDSSGEVKMELLELAGYKSSYIHMTDIVDQMFPPIHRKCAPEYTDFNYWRAPIQEYELPGDLTEPPSPSLSASARSDTSAQRTLSRLRHFSLGRSSGTSTGSSPSTSPGSSHLSNVYQGGQVQMAASVDRLSSLPSGNAMEYVIADGKRRDERGVEIHFIPNEFFVDEARRERGKNRPDSVPGSLDHYVGMQDERWFERRKVVDGGGDDDNGDGDDEGDDEDEDEDEDENEGEYTEDAAAEEAFDDDLLATGEMETVPFL